MPRAFSSSASSLITGDRLVTALVTRRTSRAICGKLSSRPQCAHDYDFVLFNYTVILSAWVISCHTQRLQAIYGFW